MLKRVLVALVAMLCLPMAAMGQGTPTATEPTVPVGTSLDNPQNVGKTVTVNCVLLKVYSAETVESTPNGYIHTFSETDKYLIMDVEIRNVCDNGNYEYGVNWFSAIDTGNGERYDDYGPSFDYDPAIDRVTLEPKRKIRGFLGIVIAKDARRVVLEFDTSGSDRPGTQIYFEINVRLPDQQ
jgi:hypothetical protein